MILVIDGLNLIPNIKKFKIKKNEKEKEQAILDLITYLSDFANHLKKKPKIYVFFDGRKRPGDNTRQETINGIHCYYSHDVYADDLIGEFIKNKRAKNVSGIKVISSDKKVQQTARLYCYDYQSSEDFYLWAERTKKKATPEKPEDISKKEGEEMGKNFWKVEYFFNHKKNGSSYAPLKKGEYMHYHRFVALTLITMVFSFALKPEKDYKAIPSDYGVIYREVEFLSGDGLKLKGWFIPAQDTTGISNSIIGRVMPVPDDMKAQPREYQADTIRKPTIIICDGDAGNMTQFIFYGYHFFTKGYNVFLFDWRGFGESADWNTEQDRLCYGEYIADYDAAIDFVKKQPEVDTSRIGVLGFSTGAYLSFAIIAKRRDISAYAGRALMSSFEELLAVLKKSLPERNFIAPDNYPSELEPINAVERINIPVFLIVGEKDNRTPVWMSEKIMVKLKEPKELWIVSDAEHGGIRGPEFINYPEFFDRVLTFFDKYLKN